MLTQGTYSNVNSRFGFLLGQELAGVGIKAMLGMLGGGENLCDWLFMMELLPLGCHCMRN